jgi:chromate reductase
MILTLNGALNGADGSTHVCMSIVEDALAACMLRVHRVNLVEHVSLASIVDHIEKARGIVFGTGTYWDSWGSPMQKLLEDLAGLDSSELLFGKPAAVVVTEHSTGGKSVFNRMLGVLNTMGMWVPPHCAAVYSMVAHEALERGMDGWKAMETWRLSDFSIIGHNLAAAVYGTREWKSWHEGNDLSDEPFRTAWLKA